MNVELAKKNAANIADYLNFLQYRQVSRHTVTNYEVTLRNLYNYCAVNDLEMAALSSADILHYVAADYKAYTASTQRTKLSALSAFYDYLIINQKATQSPILKILFPKAEYNHIPPFKDDLYPSFATYIDDHSNPIYALGIDLMYSSGLRVSEAASLDILRDIKINGGDMTIKVLGKGKRKREVPVFGRKSQKLINSLRTHVSTIIPFRLDINAQVVNYHLTMWAKANKIEGSYSCHSFRHAFALRAMRAYKDIEVVRYLLGHEQYNTTLIYLYNNNKLIYDIDRHALIV